MGIGGKAHATRYKRADRVRACVDHERVGQQPPYFSYPTPPDSGTAPTTLIAPRPREPSRLSRGRAPVASLAGRPLLTAIENGAAGNQI